MDMGGRQQRPASTKRGLDTQVHQGTGIGLELINMHISNNLKTDITIIMLVQIKFKKILATNSRDLIEGEALKIGVNFYTVGAEDHKLLAFF